MKFIDFEEVYWEDLFEDDEDGDYEIDENLELESLFKLDKNGEGKWGEMSWYKYNQTTLDN